MESNTSIPRRRPSHVRENYAVGPDRPFLIKRNRGKSREQTRLLSDDDNTPMARGDNRRRKKKIFSSSPNIPSTSGHHPGPSTDASHAIVERTHKSHKYKHDVSRPFPDPTSLARTASREGRRPSTKASSVAAASDDDAGLQANQSGPIATMEFSRMKRELETLKKQATAQKRTIEKQANVGCRVLPFIFFLMLVSDYYVFGERPAFNAPDPKGAIISDGYVENEI
jgi:hypothetical protein